MVSQSPATPCPAHRRWTSGPSLDAVVRATICVEPLTGSTTGPTLCGLGASGQAAEIAVAGGEFALGPDHRVPDEE